jgi:hypothetical protein
VPEWLNEAMDPDRLDRALKQQAADDAAATKRGTGSAPYLHRQMTNPRSRPNPEDAVDPPNPAAAPEGGKRNKEK